MPHSSTAMAQVSGFGVRDDEPYAFSLHSASKGLVKRGCVSMLQK